MHPSNRCGSVRAAISSDSPTIVTWGWRITRQDANPSRHFRTFASGRTCRVFSAEVGRRVWVSSGGLAAPEKLADVLTFATEAPSPMIPHGLLCVLVLRDHAHQDRPYEHPGNQAEDPKPERRTDYGQHDDRCEETTDRSSNHSYILPANAAAKSRVDRGQLHTPCAGSRLSSSRSPSRVSSSTFAS